MTDTTTDTTTTPTFPFPLPPLVAYLIAATSAIAALVATQGLISNGSEKLITGIAAIVLPLGYLAVNAVAHAAHAKVVAAAIANGGPLAAAHVTRTRRAKR